MPLLRGIGVKLREAVDLFLEDRHLRGCSDNGMEAYRQHCTLFVDWLESAGVFEVSDLHSRWIAKYLDSLRSRNQLRRQGKLSPETVYKRMKHLRTFFIWLVKKQHVSKDVDLSFPMPRKKLRLPKALAPEQSRRLLAVAMSERDRAIISLMLFAGLRIAETTALTLDDIDLNRNRVHIQHGKGDKERHAIYEPEVSEWIRAWLAVRKSATPFVFVDRWGKHLTISGVYKIVKRAAKRAGVKVNPHMLRHTFATEFWNAGGQPYDLQLLMGHERIETTMIYAKVAIDSVQERFAGVGLFKRLARK